MDIAHWDIAHYQGIINNGNAQVQGLRNEFANARDRITLLNISLDNERIESNTNQEECRRTLNNEREACRRRMAMMDQALNDERAARQLQQNLAAAQNAERQRLQTNAQNQVNRMIANIARKQA